MDRSTFLRNVAAIGLGKRLPDGVYVHVSILPQLSPNLQEAVREARELAAIPENGFNVIKLSLREWKLSLLSYPAFFEEAFPSLAASWAIDLGKRTVTFRAYDANGNPPILHRKERLVATDHPCAKAWTAISARAEALGLFSDTRSIGMRAPWEARLARLGVHVRGHDLIEAKEPRADADGDPIRERAPAREPEVHRHRTALQRHSLSTPMQALFRHRFLDERCTVFDYGCGRGDDVRLLRDLGVDASGWDPHFAPRNERRDADVVNLGFVLNVIEDERERREALSGAFTLAKRVLAVAALIGGRTAYEQHRLFRDGVLTSRGTFQKYFTQGELREYLEETLRREPIAVAPGIFFIFRDDVEEQRFLASRQTTARCPVHLPKPERAPRVRTPRSERAPKPPKVTRWELHRELLDDFWNRCVELGRPPTETEYGRIQELRTAVGSPQTILRKLRAERGESSLEAARRARMDDLLVYLALNLFERRRSFRNLPENVQRDIAGFWGSYAAAQTEATNLLFSLASTDRIEAACESAAQAGVGFLEPGDALHLHSSLVGRLPAILRVYAGCAARLYGEVEAADLLKIHIRSGKLSLMTYDDFEGKPLPRLLERVKIDLRAQRVIFFDHGQGEATQLLYRKSRYVTPDYPRFEEQRAFDAALEAMGIDLCGFGPDAQALEACLDARGLTVNGFRIARRRPPNPLGRARPGAEGEG